MDLKLKTYSYKYAFLCGLFSKGDFLSFIDEIIISLENPPYEFIESSLNASKSSLDIISPLNEFLGNYTPDKEAFSSYFLQIVKEKYLSGIDFKLLITQLSMLTSIMPEFYDFDFSNDCFRTIVYLDDYISLNNQGILNNIDEVKDNFEVLIGLKSN